MNAIISKEKVERLKRIVQSLDPDTQIVVSSTWRESRRHLELLIRVLEENGMKLHGVTRDTNKNEPRGHEILDYLVELVRNENLDFPNNILILDDEEDMYPLNKYLVSTSWMGGLCDKHIDRVRYLYENKLLSVNRYFIMNIYGKTERKN